MAGSASGTLLITLQRSAIGGLGCCVQGDGRGPGASRSQQATLRGLGLRKRTSTVERESAPAG